MRRAASRALAAALLATGVGVLVAGLVLAFVDGSGSTGDALTALAATATMLVGGLVVWTRADHRLGWMFLLAGLLLGLLPAVDAYTAYLDKHDADPIVALVWIAEWWWLPMLFFAFVFWLFLFPDGHLPGPRWRIPFGIALATCAVSTVLAALDPKLDDGDKYSVANPIGVSGLHDIETGASGVVLSVLFVGSMLAAAASLVVRFRRSGGVERRQIKWITLGGVAIVLGFLVLGGLNGLGVRLDWAYGALFLIVPVTIAIAILRHRLYDVDLVIRRTLVYGVVSVLLVAAYVGLVLAGQAVFSSFAGGSNLAIAGSTLVVAALFLPARARVQRLVDRRFYRRRYDARRTLEAFGSRLREEIDLETLARELRSVVVEAMQPSHASLWLRERPR